MKLFSLIGLTISASLLISINSAEYQNQGFRVNNIGCKSFDQNGKCKQCSNRYYMNSQSICQPVNTNCNDYNLITGACVTCYDGFIQIQDTCLPKAIFKQFDINCNQFQNGKCVKCSKGFFFDQNGKCKQLDPNCMSHDEAIGKCLSCYPGYELVNNKCIRQQLDPGCKTYLNGICQQCSSGYYFSNQNGLRKCIKISDKCKNFDIQKSVCTQCYQGYALDITNQCIKQDPKQVQDPNCRLWANGICSQCSSGAYFNNEKRCILIDPQCKDFDRINKICKACYTGFKLNASNLCQQDKSLSTLDPNCKEWNNGVCVICSVGSYKNNDGKCLTIDPSCKNFNILKRQCQQCYAGYELGLDKNCKKSQIKQQDSKYKFCKKWDQNQTICLQCSTGAYFNKKRQCALIDPFCKNFDQLNQKCNQCYRGYKVSGAKCILKTQDDIDKYCIKFVDQNQSICSKCAQRFYINPVGRCTQIDKSCNTYNSSTGVCTGCYTGYKLDAQNKCIFDQTVNNDANCKTWINGICTQCSKGSYLSKNGRCQLIDPQCQKFDEKLQTCLACYSGFRVQLGKCIQDKEYLNRDPFCAQFKDNICQKCSQGYYFNQLNKCTQVNVLCATVNLQNGKCLSCFPGYELNPKGDCDKKKVEISDLFCAKFSDNGECTECSKGFYFNSQKKCTAIDPICKVFDSKLEGCTDCYPGFLLQNLKCILDEKGLKQSLCAQWKNGACVKCNDRCFMGFDGKCKQVSKLCKAYDGSNGRCTACYSGFSLNSLSGECQKASQIVGCAQIDQNGKCKRCSKGYYLSQANNKCEQVDPDCAQFDFTIFKCKGCYPGYSLINEKCILNRVQQDKKIQNCVKYDGQGKCIECFDRFYVNKNGNNGRGICNQVSFFCKGYDKYSGACTLCYTGFTLKGSECASDEN